MEDRETSRRLSSRRLWEIFGDAQLNALEEQVVVSNQDLKAAEARFREARATVKYNRAAEFPTVAVAPSIMSIRDSPNGPYFPIGFKRISSTGEFILPFDFYYEIDLWGRIRRTVAAAREEAQATAADLQTVSLSLHAELAIDYFDLRSADGIRRPIQDRTTGHAPSPATTCIMAPSTKTAQNCRSICRLVISSESCQS